MMSISPLTGQLSEGMPSVQIAGQVPQAARHLGAHLDEAVTELHVALLISRAEVKFWPP